jgi:hypothetical protein
MSKCCPDATFPHFSPQSLHLSICYYHRRLLKCRHRIEILRRFNSPPRAGKLNFSSSAALFAFPFRSILSKPQSSSQTTSPSSAFFFIHFIYPLFASFSFALTTTKRPSQLPPVAFLAASASCLDTNHGNCTTKSSRAAILFQCKQISVYHCLASVETLSHPLFGFGITAQQSVLWFPEKLQGILCS